MKAGGNDYGRRIRGGDVERGDLCHLSNRSVKSVKHYVAYFTSGSN